MRRRGVTMLEVVFAIAIVAGPAIYALSLIQSNTRSARFDAERAAGLLLLNDVAEMLKSESPAGLQAIAGAGGSSRLQEYAKKRIAVYPGGPDEPIRKISLELVPTLSSTFQEHYAGVDGLACLTLAAMLERGGPVTVVRTLRMAGGTHTVKPR